MQGGEPVCGMGKTGGHWPQYQSLPKVEVLKTIHYYQLLHSTEELERTRTADSEAKSLT